MHLNLSRNILEGVLGAIKFNRRVQDTLGGTACATRFKFFDDEGALRPICYPPYGAPDSFEPLILRTGAARWRERSVLNFFDLLQLELLDVIQLYPAHSFPTECDLSLE